MTSLLRDKKVSCNIVFCQFVLLTSKIHYHFALLTRSAGILVNWLSGGPIAEEGILLTFTFSRSGNEIDS